MPLAYFITFSTYGTWLHGDDRGSVDRQNNGYRTPFLPRNGVRQSAEQSLLRETPFVMGDPERAIVDAAIRGVCTHRNWPLHIVNVRTNHVHLVVTASHAPERVMNDFKVWGRGVWLKPDSFLRDDRCGLGMAAQSMCGTHRALNA